MSMMPLVFMSWLSQLPLFRGAPNFKKKKHHPACQISKNVRDSQICKVKVCLSKLFWDPKNTTKKKCTKKQKPFPTSKLSFKKWYLPNIRKKKTWFLPSNPAADMIRRWCWLLSGCVHPTRFSPPKRRLKERLRKTSKAYCIWRRQREKWWASWWLNQPIGKICSSKWVHLPQIEVKIQNLWNHHPVNEWFSSWWFRMIKILLWWQADHLHQQLLYFLKIKLFLVCLRIGNYQTKHI